MEIKFCLATAYCSSCGDGLHKLHDKRDGPCILFLTQGIVVVVLLSHTMDEYDRLAITMKIEDISSCEDKQGILRRLKENGQYFDRGLWLQPDDGSYDEFASEGWCPPRNDYFPDNEKEFAWLGYFLGKCTNVRLR